MWSMWCVVCVCVCVFTASVRHRYRYRYRYSTYSTYRLPCTNARKSSRQTCERAHRLENRFKLLTVISGEEENHHEIASNMYRHVLGTNTTLLGSTAVQYVHIHTNYLCSNARKQTRQNSKKQEKPTRKRSSFPPPLPFPASAQQEPLC